MQVQHLEGKKLSFEFTPQPFFSNGEAANRITGRIRLSSEVLCTFEGHWDQQIYIKELTNRVRDCFSRNTHRPIKIDLVEMCHVMLNIYYECT